MYLNAQIQPLLALIEDIATSEDNAGCGDDLTVASKSAIDRAVKMAKELKSSARHLVIGLHTHRHGHGQYAFAVPPGQAFSRHDFLEHLGNVAGPEHEEGTYVAAIDEQEIKLIEPLIATNG